MNKKMEIVVLLSGLAVAIQAQEIYQDNFSRDGRAQPGGFTQVLKASTPFNTTADGQWWKTQWNSGSVSFSIASSGTLRTGNSTLANRGAFLDFTPENGKVYTLSVDMSVAGSTGNGFLAMGFSANTLHIDDYETAQAAWDAGSGVSYTGGEYTHTIDSALGGWKLNADNTSSTFKDAGYSGVQVGGVPVAGFNTFQAVLDTSGANWTLEWLLNGTSIRTETYDTNPMIRNVFLGVENVLEGTFQKFSLTSSPKTLKLIVISN